MTRELPRSFDDVDSPTKLRVQALAVEASPDQVAEAECILRHRRVDGTLEAVGSVRDLRGVLRAARLADVTVVLGSGPSAAATSGLLGMAGVRAVRLSDLATVGSARHGETLAASRTDDQVSRLAVLAHRPGVGVRSARAVSIVVTVLNEVGQVDALLDALLQQLEADDELIVVDGGSVDGTLERLDERAATAGQLRVLRRPGTNISAGRNAGIAEATNAIIACTDAGCSPDEHWLSALRAAFEETPQPGLVASIPRVTGSSSLQDAQAMACYPDPGDDEAPNLLVKVYGKIFGQVFTPALPFARSLAFTKEAWAEVGGFPEDLGWVEDGVFGQSIASGHPAVTTRDARITWMQRGSLRATAKMYFRYGVGVAQSRDVPLMLRDGMRVAAYGASTAALLKFRGRSVAPLLTGGAAYYSLPTLRVIRNRAGIRVWLLIPFAMATKDLSKVVGQTAGHLRAIKSARSAGTR